VSKDICHTGHETDIGSSNVAAKAFGEQIDAMYNQIEGEGSAKL
jgi:hypothetical protein